MKALIKIFIVLALVSCSKEDIKTEPSKDLVVMEMENYRIENNHTYYDVVITNNNDYDVVWYSFTTSTNLGSYVFDVSDTIKSHESVSVDYHTNYSTMVFIQLDSVRFDY